MRSLMLMSILALAGCNDKTTFRKVPVEGLPAACKPDSAGLNMYKRPLVLQVEHEGGTLTQTFTGTDATPTVSLAEREDELRIRVGRCEPMRIGGNHATVVCERPEWLGDEQVVKIDPRKAGEKLVIKTTGEHPCLR